MYSDCSRNSLVKEGVQIREENFVVWKKKVEISVWEQMG